MSDHSNQVNLLNKLITTLYDGENGYKEAADDVDSTSLATRFRSLSQQRYDFGHEIKPFITQLGGTVDKGGSAAAGLHRIWIDLKSAVAGNDEKAILAECVRGEQSAIDTYQEVLADGDFPAVARETVTKQLNAITSSLNEVRQLERAYA